MDFWSGLIPITHKYNVQSIPFVVSPSTSWDINLFWLSKLVLSKFNPGSSTAHADVCKYSRCDILVVATRWWRGVVWEQLKSKEKPRNFYQTTGNSAAPRERSHACLFVQKVFKPTAWFKEYGNLSWCKAAACLLAMLSWFWTRRPLLESSDGSGTLCTLWLKRTWTTSDASKRRNSCS